MIAKTPKRRKASNPLASALDGLGIQLFDRIEGDYFAILGLPLLLLCARLRENRVLAS
jgi:septum formation protein